MVQGKAFVKNKSGLHARPAAQLVKICKMFESDITIAKGDVVCNGKSVFSVMGGCIKQGMEVCVSAEGPDEEEALEQVVSCINELEE